MDVSVSSLKSVENSGLLEMNIFIDKIVEAIKKSTTG